jgi:hypothetical protein
MHIEIAERLRPFSHRPGTSFLLPGTTLTIEIFPAFIRIKDLSLPLPKLLKEVHLEVQGPVADFTALLDLERGEIRVFGESAKGYFRYRLHTQDQQVILSIEKAPHSLLPEGQQSPMVLCQNLNVVDIKTKTKVTKPQQFERLSLGSHRKQDWELVQRRASWETIFPIWHRLGQMTPAAFVPSTTGTALLLEQCQQAIEAHAPEKILKTFRSLFLAGFEGVLSPRLVDTDFHGIIREDSQDSALQGSPLTLITEGAKLIRFLFVQEKEEGAVHLLPELPPEFHCGRFLNVECGKQGVLNMEWTKKAMRMMTFAALEKQRVRFLFGQKECRLRHSYEDRGVKYISGTEIEIEPGLRYWFDSFKR